MRHILVTGGTGQVGNALKALEWPADVMVSFPTRNELDLASAERIAEAFAREPWSCVINCAAWTAVDAAEDRVADAYLANAQGPAWLADLTRHAGIPLVHVSTDYVFAGDLERPYREDDAVGPVGVYGASKLAGEMAVRTGNPRSVILRTAWVLSAHGANFAKTMLRLATDRDALSVVGDQYGNPTTARDIAAALQVIALRMIEDTMAPTGVYHFVNADAATWADLAGTIFDLSALRGGPSAQVTAITSAEYPTKAARPANSRLDTAKLTRDFGIEPRPWKIAVAEVVDELTIAKSEECVTR